MKHLFLLLPLFLGCSTNIPDFQPVQKAIPPEEEVSAGSDAQHDSDPEYWAPIFKGKWSSTESQPESSGPSSSYQNASSTIMISSSSLSVSSSEDLDPSSSSGIISSSSGGISFPAGDTVEYVMDCGASFGIAAGERIINWELSSCPDSNVVLSCASASGVSCGASLTFDQSTYFTGVGVSFILGSHSLTETGGSIEATCNLDCNLE